MLYLFLSQVFLLSVSGDAETGVDYSFNWVDQQLEIVIKKNIPDMDRALPGIKFRIEKNIEKDLSFILLKGIELLTIDSRTTGKEFIEKYPSVINSIFELTDHIKRTNSLLTRDLKTLIINYTLELNPYLVELFIPHSRPSITTPALGFIPSTDFTGIIIYVDKILPLFGKEGKGNFTPSLFPRVFDKNLNLVIGPLMEDPAAIKSFGAVGYQQPTASPDISRVGQNPLRMKAREIFGINNTDIIISDRDAEMILSRQNNIDLITQGRILIIYN